jgi:hypothetical protein
MSPEVEPNVNPVIWAAIEQKRLIRFRYKNRERIVEPHDYGMHKGVIKLFGYQVGGSSSQKLPNWRWSEQDLISDLQLLDRTFPAGVPQNRANITTGTSCSSESNRLTRTRSKPLLPARQHLYAPLPKAHEL